MAIATILGCGGFAACCGSSVATGATMTAVALPEMRKYQFSDQFSIGCIAASGNLGIMIPPSGSFIFYGFLTETSIGALFIAGILPGLLIMFAFWIQMYIQCKLNPALGPAGPWVSWLERLKSTRGLLAIFFVFLMVMGGIYAGVFTPNEGASCGVFTVFLVGLFTRQVKWKLFVSALQETILISSMIMFMIIGAMYFGSFMAISQIPTAQSRMNGFQ
jgi:tripartite ATP-independent transporter DctM subunit